MHANNLKKKSKKVLSKLARFVVIVVASVSGSVQTTPEKFQNKA